MFGDHFYFFKFTILSLHDISGCLFLQAIFYNASLSLADFITFVLKHEIDEIPPWLHYLLINSMGSVLF